ncbi:MAG: endonuclease domain-containing protein [Prevotella sp.]|nr:endonuclease domain-containing protein [Prevotella sp.]
MSFHYETAAPDRYELLKDFAKKNRREMTESERLLWEALRKLNCGYHFRRQHPIGDYIADFICIKKMLVIEVDGGYHNEPIQQQDDQVRTDYLESKGYTVIHFKNEEINNNLQEVIIRIKKQLFNE